MNEGLPNYAPKPTSQEEQEKPVKSTASVEVVETTTQLEAQEKQVEAPQKHDKAPSAEDFRKDFDRLKQREDVEPEQRTKEYRRLGQAVNDRRTELSEGAQSEQNQLQETRAKLGLVGDVQESHSGRATAHEMRGLDALDQDIQGELREGRKAEEGLERERGLKDGARHVGEAASMFAREINNRDRDGMDTFMDARAYNDLRSGAVALAEFGEGRGRADMDELGLAFARVNSGLEKMQRTRRSGPIRESEDSLGKLGYAMRNLYEATGKMSKGFREGDERASLGARRLMETSERVYDFTSRLRSAVRNMR
jgi:hypothetical protein